MLYAHVANVVSYNALACPRRRCARLLRGLLISVFVFGCSPFGSLNFPVAVMVYPYR